METACSRRRSQSRASRCFWSFLDDSSCDRMMTGRSSGCSTWAAQWRRWRMLSTMSDDSWESISSHPRVLPFLRTSDLRKMISDGGQRVAQSAPSLARKCLGRKEHGDFVPSEKKGGGMASYGGGGRRRLGQRPTRRRVPRRRFLRWLGTAAGKSGPSTRRPRRSGRGSAA
ncbi:hypothetical protein VTK73DRAFT_5546 [Phialemonium thermophilum]|uniref:Uncharacterized protein n=1 Tax=Phialemonium thermophilum TaxID=223376 RepID=A0ABR3V170_9PEZI